MNRNIKAAVLVSLKKKLVIKNLLFPELKKGQILVKILFSGVCGSQIMEQSGKRGEDKWLPHLLGHEGSGVIEKVYTGCKKFQAGDEVLLSWIKSSGYDAEVAKYISTDGDTINSGQITTFSNYSVISENRIIKKPKDLSFLHAALYGCAIPTGSGMVINENKNFNKDIRVVLIGLGGIGLSALIALISLGFKNITVVDKNINKKKVLENFPKTNFIHLINEYEKINLGTYDLCIESAGTTDSIELGFSMIKSNGQLIFASHPEKGKKIKIDPYELISGKKIIGTWGGSFNPDLDVKKFHKILKSKLIDLMITKIYRLEEINEAIDDLKNGLVQRPIIKMEH